MLGLSPLIGEVSRPHIRADLRYRTWLRLLSASFFSLLLLFMFISPSNAQRIFEIPLLGQTSVTTWYIIQFALIAGILGAAIISAVGFNRSRLRTNVENELLRARITELSNALTRNEALLNLKDQRIVVWPSDGSRPAIVGDLPSDTGAPLERNSFLAFGRWLTVKSATELERSLTALRDRSLGFDLILETSNGSLLSLQGRRAALQYVLRFTSFSQLQSDNAQLKRQISEIKNDHETLVALINELEIPFWVRNDAGKLTWVNKAYARLLATSATEGVLASEKEFLPASVRAVMMQKHQKGEIYRDQFSTLNGEERRSYDVTDVASLHGSAGIAIDISSLETLRKEHASALASHADTLDQLTTAVVSYDADQRLKSYNEAFLNLWSLDRSFLDSKPENALVLDRLRSEGKLAEHPEWRRWKDQVLAAYKITETQEHWWHLPDGRTIRVIASPQPKGGVTWIFENLTEKISLESRYNSIVQVQGETLDNLAEGVAVFGSDGRLRLSNPAFRHLWDIPEKLIEGDVHISLLKAASDSLARPSPWGEFMAAATGFVDERKDRHGQTELTTGTVLRYAIIHLPNGQTMLTFVDVTASVNVERALKDKNEALERADRLKNDFVQHVSYELRSPLTNIIGFTELLALGQTGPLTQKQSEYVAHIGSSSELLLTVVNDILDLATVDAGIMELDLSEVVIGETVKSAARLIQERLSEHNITLHVDVEEAVGTFYADENRVRQVLYNLLSNAANYAPESGRVLLTARRSGDEVIFRVHDNGPGMAPEVLQSIFKRFETRSNGGRRRGAGLGLSIVKSFVELHGGVVQIETGEGRGTAVTCRFPMMPADASVAAE